ncbi:MAG: Hsp70 family protein [Acidimicrobiales bacterium]
MLYHLGVDVGTTWTAAAVERDDRVEMVPLGNRTVAVPSVVLLRAEGDLLVGEAAERRGQAEPERLAREFKRRVGDPTPILLGGTPFGADALTGKLLRWVVDQVSEHEGGPPASIALTHPANWGAYKLDLLAHAARHAGVAVDRFVTEPEAAATFYASQERVPAGAVIAVYDLGGGTFDATVLRKREDGFDLLGTPEGIERLGGIDFDQAVFAHVARQLGGAFEALDPDAPAVRSAVARLRRDCVEGKEALSSDTDVAIPVVLPGVQADVRLTRTEFEDMIRPAVQETIDALRRALESARVAPEDVQAVLLVGGSSRIPLVGQLITGALGRPVAVDANPKHAIALGAAIAAAQQVGAASPESVTAVLPAVQAAPTPVAPLAPAPMPQQPARQAWVPAPAPAPAPARKSPVPLVLAIVGLVVLISAGVAFALTRGDDNGGDGGEVSTDSSTTTTQPTTTTSLDFEDVEANFVDLCTDRDETRRTFCQCIFDGIEAQFSFADFEEFDRQFRASGAFPDELDPIIESCRG